MKDSCDNNLDFHRTVFRGSPIERRRRSFGHLHYFTKETALAALQETGYEVIDHFYTRASVELRKRSWKGNLAKLPRAVLFALNQDWTVRMLGGFSLLVLAK